MILYFYIFQSRSSEIIPVDLPDKIVQKVKTLKAFFEKKMCAAYETFGIKACADIESHNAAFIRDSALYSLIGKHAVNVEVASGT